MSGNAQRRLATYVVAENEIESWRAQGDTAEVRVAFDRSNGCERLEQRVIRFHPGRSLPRAIDGRQEILYVAAGTGTLWLRSDEHPLEPETGVFLEWAREHLPLQEGRPWKAKPS